MDKTLIRRRFARSVRSYAEYAQAQRLIAERMCTMLRSLLPDRPADVLEIGCGTSLIVSCSVMQWFEDPERFIRRCHDLLTPGGILALSTFGPDNLREVKDITGSGLDYPPLERLRQMLSSAGLETVAAEEESIVLDFPSAIDVLRHLKHTGVNGIIRTSWTPARLASFSDEYLLRFGTPDGNVTLTYHPVYLIARRQKTLLD